MDKKHAFAVIKGTLPAHYDGLVGVYVQDVFKPERVVMHRAPGVYALLRAGLIPFDGAEYELESTCALSVGAFIAFHVRSTNDSPRDIEIEVHGLHCSELAPGEIGRGFMTGLVLPPTVERGEA